jgi:glycosyltransferase involved in cell wall biosynthesis
VTTELAYAVVTPVRDEAENLPRLAECLRGQTFRPTVWVIVDNGSSDGTLELAEELARREAWVKVLTVPDDAPVLRGGRVVRAFQAGLTPVDEAAEVIVKLDADVSMAPDYFARLLRGFADSPRLGIASGSGYEEKDGVWRERHVTGGHVWGASRAYRRACLRDVLPLEERMGWDGIDELKASGAGWTTATLDIPFRHHRKEGERDGRATVAWASLGKAAHYMGYRPWYLALRALHHARREPAALAMIWGYGGAAIRREGRCSDETVRQVLRQRQSVSKLLLRVREVTEERRALT